MAFLSDTNGSWARAYVQWQNPRSSAFASTSHQELGHGADILYKAREVAGMGPADTPHPAEYLGRFWVNVVRWLGEKSLRLEERGVLGRSEQVAVEPGGRVQVSAGILAAIDPATLPDLRVDANLAGSGEKSELRWDRERREFVGEVAVPENAQGSLVDIALTAHLPDGDLSDRLRLGLLKIDPELKDPAPNRELMADLSQSTGGQLLAEAGEAGKILQAARREVEAATFSFRQPVWGRWDIFLILIGLLVGEWLLRRVLAK
jgi:hypothetical protein